MTVPSERQNNALQMIFSFFLGLMVVAVVGIAVNTFYESPMAKYQDELQKLYRQQESLNMKGGGTMSAEDQAQYNAIMSQIDALNAKEQAESKNWARNTSIILIACATFVMIVSLIRSDQLRVISNGLLLGGIGTMLYGTGWGVYSGSSIVRFLVVLFAFVVSIGLGYAKFVMGRKTKLAGVVAPGSAAQSATSAGVAQPAEADAIQRLSDRIGALENRLDAIGAAFGPGSGERPSRSV